MFLCEFFRDFLGYGVGVKCNSVLLPAQCDVHFYELWSSPLSGCWFLGTSARGFFRGSSLLWSRGNRILNERPSCFVLHFLHSVGEHLLSSSSVTKNGWLEGILVFLFAQLDFILITVCSFGLMILLRLLVKFFPFVCWRDITAGLLIPLVYFGFERTLYLVLFGLFLHFLGCHQLSSLLVLVCLVKQVLAEADRAGGHFCLMMSSLVDFGFVGQVFFVDLFFRLIVFCLCAADKIVAVLGQSQVNLRNFLCVFESQCVFTLVIHRAQELPWGFGWRKFFVLGLSGVHPGETEILNGTHIDLGVLGFDLLFA